MDIPEAPTKNDAVAAAARHLRAAEAKLEKALGPRSDPAGVAELTALGQAWATLAAALDD